jgi:large conductance mechanosensitive channel
MLSEFKAFLLKQNVVALAIAVVVGAALSTLVKAVVDDFVMPIVGALTPSGDWQKATFDVGPFKFGVGNFASALLNFFIVGFVAWRITKLFVKPEVVAPKPATKDCQFCRMTIAASATRCPHCTSQLT